MRALGRFWAGILTVLVVGAAVLQWLGPPPPQSSPAAAPSAATEAPVPTLSAAAVSPSLPPTLPWSGAPAATTAEPAATPPATTVAASAGVAAPTYAPFALPGKQTPGPIAAPDPALLSDPPSVPDAYPLPRIAEDGRTPMHVYARGFDPSTRRPRIALVVAGVGLNAADSDDAVRTLPGEVTLAFSPYAASLDRLLDTARANGHEFLVSIPMEPQGYPLNDPGDHALLTGAAPAVNRANLNWALGRVEGYVGATGALGAMRGERFASLASAIEPVLGELSQRGLLYLDPRPGAPPPPLVWGRSIDVVLDTADGPAAFGNMLDRLEQTALSRGSAVGLVTSVNRTNVRRLADWARGLRDRGLILAPVSALVTAPPARATR